MHRVNVSLYAAALTILISGPWWGSSVLSAKERAASLRHSSGESGGLYLCCHQGRSHALYNGNRQSTPGERCPHRV